MKISGGFAPRPPNISFLLTFNFSQLLQHSPDFYSLQRKYQNFSWGLCPQTPSYLLPVYIQLLPLSISHLSTFTRFLLITAQISKFSWGLRPQTPHISFLFTFNFSPLYILSINIHQTPRFLLITAQISKIFLGASPPESRPPQISFLLTFNYAPRPPHKSFL